MSSQYFICHAAADRELAVRLAEVLESAGFARWLPSRDQSSDLTYEAAIQNAIECCDAIVLVHSDNANYSPDITNQIAIGLRIGKVIIPTSETNPSATILLQTLAKLTGTAADERDSRPFCTSPISRKARNEVRSTPQGQPLGGNTHRDSP